MMRYNSYEPRAIRQKCPPWIIGNDWFLIISCVCAWVKLRETFARVYRACAFLFFPVRLCKGISRFFRYLVHTLRAVPQQVRSKLMVAHLQDDLTERKREVQISCENCVRACVCVIRSKRMGFYSIGHLPYQFI